LAVTRQGKYLWLKYLSDGGEDGPVQNVLAKSHAVATDGFPTSAVVAGREWP